jgi:hypothetical protein
MSLANGCCGGPAVESAAACCVADHEAKLSGAAGCDCGSTTG